MGEILSGSWQCWNNFHCTNCQFVLCPVTNVTVTVTNTVPVPLTESFFLGGIAPWEKDQ